MDPTDQGQAPASRNVDLEPDARGEFQRAVRWTIDTPAGFLDITDPSQIAPRDILAQALVWDVEGRSGLRVQVMWYDDDEPKAFVEFLVANRWSQDPEFAGIWLRLWPGLDESTIDDLVDALLDVLAEAFGLTTVTIDRVT